MITLLTDTELFDALQDWYRRYRNQGLNEVERIQFRAVIAECRNRGWLLHYADADIA